MRRMYIRLQSERVEEVKDDFTVEDQFKNGLVE